MCRDEAFLKVLPIIMFRVARVHVLPHTPRDIHFLVTCPSTPAIPRVHARTTPESAHTQQTHTACALYLLCAFHIFTSTCRHPPLTSAFHLSIALIFKGASRTLPGCGCGCTRRAAKSSTSCSPRHAACVPVCHQPAPSSRLHPAMEADLPLGCGLGWRCPVGGMLCWIGGNIG